MIEKSYIEDICNKEKRVLVTTVAILLPTCA